MSPHFNHPAPLTPEYTSIAQKIVQWARDFLASPLLQARPYEPKDVCPFIKGSLERNSFYLLFHPEINGYDEAAIERLLDEYTQYFKELRPHSKEESGFKTILLVFPLIQKQDLGVLDKVTKKVKSSFVKNALMLAAFYPGCDDRSIHNDEFRTSDAPYPLIAVREMAQHDILFLDEDPEWFNAYNLHYGSAYAALKRETLDGKNLFFYDRYQKAKKKFSAKKTR